MSGLFESLALRGAGPAAQTPGTVREAAVLVPRPRSRYEPSRGAPASVAPSSLVEETSARVATPERARRVDADRASHPGRGATTARTRPPHVDDARGTSPHANASTASRPDHEPSDGDESAESTATRSERAMPRSGRDPGRPRRARRAESPEREKASARTADGSTAVADDAETARRERTAARAATPEVATHAERSVSTSAIERSGPPAAVRITESHVDEHRSISVSIGRIEVEVAPPPPPRSARGADRQRPRGFAAYATARRGRPR